LDTIDEWLGMIVFGAVCFVSFGAVEVLKVGLGRINSVVGQSLAFLCWEGWKGRLLLKMSFVDHYTSILEPLTTSRELVCYWECYGGVHDVAGPMSGSHTGALYSLPLDPAKEKGVRCLWVSPSIEFLTFTPTVLAFKEFSVLIDWQTLRLLIQTLQPIRSWMVRGTRTPISNVE
jgi:hypothetical protein